MMRPGARHIATFIALAVLFAASRSVLFSASLAPAVSKKEVVRTWDLPTELLLALAGEFKGLTADLVVLEAGALIGGPTEPEDQDWEGIMRLFRHAMALDPYFLHTCNIMQGVLPWEAGKVHETLDLLSISKDHRSWDWQPGYWMGFDNYYFLGRNAEGGRLLLEAANKPNAPPFLAIIGARLMQKGGETEAAIALLKTMLAQQDEEDPVYEEVRTRLLTLNGVKIIEKAVARFKIQFGKKPNELAELVETGILKALPENPSGLPYCLDQNGRVLFDSAECLTGDADQASGAKGETATSA